MATLKLRGHHLLCLLGFRGLGYSPGFVLEMGQVKQRLGTSPQTEVEVQDEPDVICLACPHLRDSRCARDIDAEERVKGKDRRVMAYLDIEKGSVLSWEQVLSRIRQRLDEDTLSRLCATCRWFPIGYCRAGLREVRAKDV